LDSKPWNIGMDILNEITGYNRNRIFLFKQYMDILREKNEI